MNNPIWLIQTNLINADQTAEVSFAARNSGASVIGAKVIPFQDEVEFWEEPSHDIVIPYGSCKLTKLALKRGWKGVFFNDDFNVSAWNKNRSDMLNSDVRIMSIGEASAIDDPDDELLFIRPLEDLKIFAGSVTTAKEIKNWMKSNDSGSFSLNQDTMVSISSPKKILAEWRWFVVDGKVIDGSIYRWRGQLYPKHEDDPALLQEAQEMADRWLPHQTVCMDLALTNDGLKVVEFNAFNASGFYKSDISKIIKAVNGLFQ